MTDTSRAFTSGQPSWWLGSPDLYLILLALHLVVDGTGAIAELPVEDLLFDVRSTTR